MTIVEMQMNIDCDGCEDNVRKALLRLQGVHYVEVDRLRGKVTVTGSVSQKKALRAARRTGRLAVFWPSAYNHPEYHHAYAHAHAQPAAYYQYQPAKLHAAAAAAAAPAQAQRHHYSAVPHGGKNTSGGGALQQQQRGAMSSYNYRVHGYFDSDLHGYHHRQRHEQAVMPSLVPDAAGSYFSDDNPHACSIM